MSRSCFSRLSSRSFRCGCTPTHPFVNASAVAGSRPGPLEDLTPRILLATVSPCMAVSITLTLRLRSGVHVPPQTGLAGEGLFPRGRADATEIRWLMRWLFRLGLGFEPSYGARFCAFSFQAHGASELWNGGEGRGCRGRGLVPLFVGTRPAKSPHGCKGATIHLGSPLASSPAWLTRPWLAASVAADRRSCTVGCS